MSTAGICRIDDGRYSIWCKLCRCGDDISLAISGGDRPHIGAAALAVSRPSLSDKTKLSATVSSICVTGHKDDELARNSANKLAAKYNCVVVVSIGLHIDNASRDDIGHLYENFSRLMEQVDKMQQRWNKNNKSLPS
ncbi:MAG: hypothetical protein LBG05_09785 [Treponema sp.]|jgi:hypothetical protein|nr:hypothetical protein [Treponema sp.]